MWKVLLGFAFGAITTAFAMVITVIFVSSPAHALSPKPEAQEKSPLAGALMPVTCAPDKDFVTFWQSFHGAFMKNDMDLVQRLTRFPMIAQEVRSGERRLVEREFFGDVLAAGLSATARDGKPTMIHLVSTEKVELCPADSPYAGLNEARFHALLFSKDRGVWNYAGSVADVNLKK